MAQRMGSVEMFVRIGDVDAPLVPLASADYVVALEMIEALRAARYLRRCGWLLASNIFIPPPGSGGTLNRERVAEALRALPAKTVIVDVRSIARELGDPRVVNMAMLGVLLATDDIGSLVSVEVAEDVVRTMLGETNRKALLAGYTQAREKIGSGGVYAESCSQRL